MKTPNLSCIITYKLLYFRSCRDFNFFEHQTLSISSLIFKLWWTFFFINSTLSPLTFSQEKTLKLEWFSTFQRHLSIRVKSTCQDKHISNKSIVRNIAYEKHLDWGSRKLREAHLQDKRKQILPGSIILVNSRIFSYYLLPYSLNTFSFRLSNNNRNNHYKSHLQHSLLVANLNFQWILMTFIFFCGQNVVTINPLSFKIWFLLNFTHQSISWSPKYYPQWIDNLVTLVLSIDKSSKAKQRLDSIATL